MVVGYHPLPQFTSTLPFFKERSIPPETIVRDTAVGRLVDLLLFAPRGRDTRCPLKPGPLRAIWKFLEKPCTEWM